MRILETSAAAMAICGLLMFSSEGSASAPEQSQARLERELAKMLDNVVLVGTWQMTSGDGMQGKKRMAAPAPEIYFIDGALKEEGDEWAFRARIQFTMPNREPFDVPIAMRLPIRWNGDTPMIVIDNIAFPGIGTYSARVMLYKNFYAGTWFGSNYGGVLSGQIVKRDVYDRLFAPSKDSATPDDAP